LLKQPDLQFQLSVSPAPQHPILDWLRGHLGPLGKVLGEAGRFLAPVAPYVFWAGVAIGLASILFVIGQRLVAVKPGLTLNRFSLSEGAPAWRPAPEQARALLEEADRLAAQGLFVEAAHVILLRSIQDIQDRRPHSLAISLTSRDIARLDALPPSARTLFAGIAEAVEQSLFGGRPLDKDGFARCREAYQAFAQAGSWA
jgi:hypothetical protein